MLCVKLNIARDSEGNCSVTAILMFAGMQAPHRQQGYSIYQSLPTRDIYANHRLYLVNGYLHVCFYVHPIACVNLRGRFMEIHFVSLRFELGLGKNLFNDSRLVVDSEPTVALCI